MEVTLVEKLIITATVDSKASYPGNPWCPDHYEIDRIAEEYARCVDSGAAIVHLHGPRKLEQSLQSDGKRVAVLDLDGWRRLHESIVEKCDPRPVIQYGSAASRLEGRLELMKLHPDMMSVIFTAHDEFFQPDPSYPPTEILAVHPRDELQAYVAAGREHDVKLEIECFHPGALFNLRLVDAVEPIPRPLFVTLFLGWPGGTWMPPTPDALLFMRGILPPDVNWNLSVMNPPTAWQLLSQAITLGGHVRVGWEDNPYLPSGAIAERCHELVDVIAGMARSVGREIATPDEARELIFRDALVA
jgi:3-keto-5-aminohexanoate cleavage enzyme